MHGLALSPLPGYSGMPQSKDMHLHFGDKQIRESKLTLGGNVTLTCDPIREEE